MTVKRHGRIPRIFCVLLVILVVLLSCYIFYMSRLRFNFMTRVNKIRAVGHPVTLQGFNDSYSIPESAENSADVLLEAMSYYKKPDPNIYPLPVCKEPLSQEKRDIIIKSLFDNSKTLELLHKAAKLKYSCYPIDFNDGFYTQLPHLAEVRNGLYLLRLESLIAVENGQTELAVRYIESMVGIVNSLSKEPCTISQLVNIDGKKIIVNSIERLFNRAEFTENDLSQLSRVLFYIKSSSDAYSALPGERCMAIDLFQMAPHKMRRCLESAFMEEFKMSNWELTGIIFYKLAGIAYIDGSHYLDVMSDYIGTKELPLHERIKAVESIDARNRISATHILSSIMTSGVPHIINLGIRCAANILVAEVGIEIERYHLDTGYYPEKLSDIVPDYLGSVPKDPFNGNDLIYKKLDVGFCVYSVAEDGIDNDGQKRDRDNKELPYDVSFRVSN